VTSSAVYIRARPSARSNAPRRIDLTRVDRAPAGAPFTERQHQAKTTVYSFRTRTSTQAGNCQLENRQLLFEAWPLRASEELVSEDGEARWRFKRVQKPGPQKAQKAQITNQLASLRPDPKSREARRAFVVHGPHPVASALCRRGSAVSWYQVTSQFAVSTCLAPAFVLARSARSSASPRSIIRDLSKMLG